MPFLLIIHNTFSFKGCNSQCQEIVHFLSTVPEMESGWGRGRSCCELAIAGIGHKQSCQLMKKIQQKKFTNSLINLHTNCNLQSDITLFSLIFFNYKYKLQSLSYQLQTLGLSSISWNGGKTEHKINCSEH